MQNRWEFYVNMYTTAAKFEKDAKERLKNPLLKKNDYDFQRKANEVLIRSNQESIKHACEVKEVLREWMKDLPPALRTFDRIDEEWK